MYNLNNFLERQILFTELFLIDNFHIFIKLIQNYDTSASLYKLLQKLCIFIKKQRQLNQMQNRERKQKETRVIPVTSYFSMFKKVPRDGLSLSSSRGKKYFRRCDKNYASPNEITSSFTKREIKENYKNDNDYGLCLNPKQNPFEMKKTADPKISRNSLKNDQSNSRNKLENYRNKSIKKYRKYSDKAKSCQSLLRVSESTPMKKSLIRTNERSTQVPCSPVPNEAKKYEKTIKFLQKQNQYFEGLYLNSQQRIEALKRQTEEEKRKYDRVRKIYQQKITQLSHNKQACQKNLGHIYSYDSQPADFVPQQVIVENSLECSTQELNIGSRKNSDFNTSKISTLSVNSR